MFRAGNRTRNLLRRQRTFARYADVVIVYHIHKYITYLLKGNENLSRYSTNAQLVLRAQEGNSD